MAPLTPPTSRRQGLLVSPQPAARGPGPDSKERGVSCRGGVTQEPLLPAQQSRWGLRGGSRQLGSFAELTDLTQRGGKGEGQPPEEATSLGGSREPRAHLCLSRLKPPCAEDNASKPETSHPVAFCTVSSEMSVKPAPPFQLPSSFRVLLPPGVSAYPAIAVGRRRDSRVPRTPPRTASLFTAKTPSPREPFSGAANLANVPSPALVPLLRAVQRSKDRAGWLERAGSRPLV